MIQPTMTVTIAQVGIDGIGSAGWPPAWRGCARPNMKLPGQCGGLELVHGRAGDEPLRVIWAAAALNATGLCQ